VINNSTIQLKVKQRLNKLASNDYDNIECWQIVEAFNKAQFDWCRRNLHGINSLQEGDEQSTRRIDDLQVILTTSSMTLYHKQRYFETSDLPNDYFQWKRLSILGKDDCCEDRQFVTYLAEQANVDMLLRDQNKKPSFEWGETFCTMKDNKIQIYTNDEFEVTKAVLTYYRYPTRIQIKGCTDPYLSRPDPTAVNAGLVIPTVDVPCEFKDDLIELFIDEAVKILSGDIESFNIMQVAQQSVEGNN
jgi:hypothetical protein